jgi:hypothetical protein
MPYAGGGRAWSIIEHHQTNVPDDRYNTTFILAVFINMIR